MAEASAGEVVILELAHELVPEREPFGVAILAGPAAGTSGSFSGEAFVIGRLEIVRCGSAVVADERLEDGLEFFAVLFAETGAEADVVELAMIVVQAEQQRADFPALLGVAEAADDAVGGADALDLDHAGALAGCVLAVEALGDNAVEPMGGAAADPALRGGKVGSRRRKMNASLARGRFEIGSREFLERHATGGERLGGKRLPFFGQKEIEDEIGAGRLLGEFPDAAFRGMDSLEERVEVEAAMRADDDFAIEHELARGQAAKGFDQFREISPERLAGFGLQHDLIAVAEGETAEAVPLGLIQPAGT